jgi:hypothetical protein
MRHPKRQQNHKDDTNDGADEAGFAGALADRLGPRVVLHPLNKFVRQSGKAIHADLVSKIQPILVPKS